MSIGSVMPSPVFLPLDANGRPLAGGLLYTYAAGTNTPAPVYTDVNLTIPHPNPVVLNAYGYATIFLDATSYKFVLKTSAGATVWTVDSVSATHATAVRLGEVKHLGGTADSPVLAAAYPSGATFDKLHAGTVIYIIDSAQLAGTYVLEGMLLSTAGTVTAALVNLSDGSPDTPMVAISSTNAIGERVASVPITFSGPGTAKSYGVKVRNSAGAGYAWGLSLVRTE